MNILLLAFSHFDLHKPIQEELERQGHNVFLVADVYLPLDYNYIDYNHQLSGPFRKTTKKILRKLFNIENRYWEKKFKSDEAFQQKYDRLIVLDGISFSPILLKHLRIANSSCKAVLYMWDTCKYYNFLNYKEWYDVIFAFDPQDCNEQTGVKLLPSFWVPTEQKPSKYSISMVGSDHDDRLDIVKKVVAQLDAAGLTYYIKVVSRKPKMNLQRKFRDFMHHVDTEQIYESKKGLPFVTDRPVPINEVIDMIASSDCILDTDMPVQTGATERVIWSIARKKKVISTNYNLKTMPFYNEDQVSFIDRKNPVIDMEFLKREVKQYNKAFFDDLRIDNWVKYLLA